MFSAEAPALPDPDWTGDARRPTARCLITLNGLPRRPPPPPPRHPGRLLARRISRPADSPPHLKHGVSFFEVHPLTSYSASPPQPVGLCFPTEVIPYHDPIRQFLVLGIGFPFGSSCFFFYVHPGLPSFGSNCTFKVAESFFISFEHDSPVLSC